MNFGKILSSCPQPRVQFKYRKKNVLNLFDDVF